MIVHILAAAEEIIRKISEQTGRHADEVAELIRVRQSEYGGLLNEAGAAYAVAKDLQVDTGLDKDLKVAELSDGQQGISLKGVVRTVFPTHDYDKDGRKGNVTNLFVSDGEAEIRTVLWNQEKSVIEQIKPGAKISIAGGYMKQRDVPELHVGNFGRVEILAEAKESQKPLESITAGMKNVSISGSIASISQAKEFERNGRKGKVASLVLSDGKTQRRIVLWDALTEETKNLAAGDKVLVEGGSAKENRGELEIHLGAAGKISKIA